MQLTLTDEIVQFLGKFYYSLQIDNWMYVMFPIILMQMFFT